MNDGELLERVFGGLRHFIDVQQRASSSAKLIEGDGWVAALNPAVPTRSFWNDVYYDDAAAVGQALPDIADAYERAGIVAWTVWVRPGDRELAELLESRGHRLDANPMAMGAEIDEVLATPAPEDVPFWIREGGFEAVGPLNDQAYGVPQGDFGGAFEQEPEEVRWYVAGSAGPPQACAGAVDLGDNTDITLVATAPEARGRGMAGALIRRALADARERGCRTTTLVATKLGHPVYRRLGYRDVGEIEMWERRRA